MTKKVYRSAQGKTVDIGALQLQNENVRAVGNMPVNARGDLVDAWNRPINSRNQQVARQYGRQVSNVVDEPVLTKSPEPVKSKEKSAKKVKIQAPTPPEDFDDDFVRPTVSAQPAGGLAAAIAKAREVKQEPILPARMAAKNAPGVTKI
jgi:hypothetical protein